MENVTALVRSLFHKESLDDCSLEELQAMARQYSYFTPVHLLLAEKLKTTDENLYKEQLQRLSLHFNNPLWLDYLLNSRKPEEILEIRKEEVTESTKEIKLPETAAVIEEQRSPEPVIRKVEANLSDEGFNPFKDETPVSTEKNEEPVERLAGERNTNAETETLEPMEETDAPMSIPPLPDLSQEPAQTELTLQPYHTVDYFASQGIKFTPEERPTDRFGKQLKSFTEWLKTMKRLPQSEIPKIADPVSEKKVEQMAEHSIDEGEVITETMAEVWIKQGNKEKAIETYNKLSLLNPDKSAYFASLAEQLKKS
jgi:hypothetical protein